MLLLRVLCLLKAIGLGINMARNRQPMIRSTLRRKRRNKFNTPEAIQALLDAAHVVDPVSQINAPFK